MKYNRKNNNKNQKTKPRAPGNPSARAQVYHGPVIYRSERLEESLHTEVLVETANITTTGAGLYNGVITNNPNSCAAWSVLAAVYDTYRILSIEAEYVPNYSSLPATITGGVFGMCVDHDSTGTVSTYAALALYESMIVSTVDRRLKIKFDMSGPDEAGFINTASPTGTGSIKTLLVGGTAATAYGQFFIRYRVQFKGRGV